MTHDVRQELQAALQHAQTRLAGDGEPRAVLTEMLDSLGPVVPMEQTLDPSAELARLALDHAHDAAYWIDERARLIYANRAASDMLGWSSDELLGKRVFDIDAVMQPELWPAHWIELERCGSMRVESKHRRRDGSTLHVEVRLTRIDGQPRPLILAFARDVSERVAAANELRDEQGLKAAVLDTALDCVVVMDEHGMVVEFNHASERTFGWTRDEIVGQSLADHLIPHELRAAHAAAMQRYLTTGQSSVIGQRLELPALRSDGTSVPVELAIQAIQLGERTLFTAYLRDISERRQAQDELVAARDAAEKASQAKSRFLANVSHEIRTPMTAIVGYSELLSRAGSDPSQLAAWRRMIRQNADHLLSLVDDLLDISRIEAGRLSLHPQSLEVGQLVSDAVALFETRAKDKLLDLRVRHGDGVPATVHIDGTRLRQIVVNLAGNAVKFTEKGHVEVRVQVEPRASGTGRLRITVEDSGIGIEPHKLDSLFRPFVQAHTGRPLVHGAGLGLAIVRLLVEHLGGEITVQSEPGRGTRFDVEIDVPLVDEPARSQPQENLKPADLTGMHVLVVDDNPDNRDIVRYVLEDAGATCALARDGLQGLEAIRAAHSKRRPFDVVLMDLQMPRMDGFEALREARREGLPGRIVALTAYAMAGDRERCLEAGFDGYLTKPVVTADLIRELAGHDAVASPATAPTVTDEELQSATAPEVLRSEMADDEAFRELLQKYLTRMASTVEDLAQLRERRDISGLAQLTHKIKGAAAGYGFPSIGEAAGACEQKLREDVLDDHVLAGLGELEALLRAALAGRE